MVIDGSLRPSNPKSLKAANRLARPQLVCVQSGGSNTKIPKFVGQRLILMSSSVTNKALDWVTDDDWPNSMVTWCYKKVDHLFGINIR